MPDESIKMATIFEALNFFAMQPFRCSPFDVALSMKKFHRELKKGGTLCICYFAQTWFRLEQHRFGEALKGLWVKVLLKLNGDRNWCTHKEDDRRWV